MSYPKNNENRLSVILIKIESFNWRIQQLQIQSCQIFEDDENEGTIACVAAIRVKVLELITTRYLRMKILFNRWTSDLYDRSAHSQRSRGRSRF